METSVIDNKCQFDYLSADVLVYIFTFLPTRASANSKQCCRRFLFLLERYGKMTPDLSVASTETFDPRACLQQALDALLTEPTIAFAFYKTQLNREAHRSWLAEAKAALPINCQMIAAHSHQVQVNAKGAIKHEDEFSIMLGSFPEASSVTFELTEEQMEGIMGDIEYDEGNEHTSALVEGLFYEVNPQVKQQDDIKVFIVYSTGGRFADTVLQIMQKKYPNAIIIGGICGGGNIVETVDPNKERVMPNFAEKASSMSVKELKMAIKECSKEQFHFVEKSDIINKYIELQESRFTSNIDRFHTIDTGLFGIALGGNCPVKSIVSRGVRSVLTNKIALVSDDADCCQIGEIIEESIEGYPEPIKIVKDILQVNRKESISATSFLTNSISKGPQFLGIRSSKDEGFALLPLEQSMLTPTGLNLGNLVETGDDVDLFAIDQQACIVDLDATLASLKDQLEGNELLGALMYSCGGRGPHEALNNEKMLDATHFNKYFPGLPLLGFYAGGEIGPDARAANHNVYQKGKVRLQGFTVVYGVLIVPTRSRVRSKFYDLDDTAEALAAYARQKLVI